MNDIDKILKDFDKRKQEEQDEQEQKCREKQGLQDEVYKIYDEIILPVLKELSDITQQKGHKSKIERKCNFVKFTFTPSSNVHYSFLDFSYIKSDISIMQSVSEKTGTSLKDVKYPSTVPANVNQEWVRSLTLEFIKCVLDSN